MRIPYEPTTHDSKVFLDNEDATPEANRCASNLNVSFEEFIKSVSEARPQEEIKKHLEGAQREYNRLFDAFIYGVDYGRRNPRRTDKS